MVHKVSHQVADGVLVAQACGDDTAAFELLVRRYFGRVYRIALRIGGDADAPDIAQDVFVTAWRRLPEIRTEQAFAAWLYRIATTRAINAVRARPPESGIDQTFLPPSAAPGPQQHALATDLRAALTRELSHLPAGQRDCWMLRELEGMSYSEIADITRTSPDAVRGRIHRARTRLAAELTPWR
jgi:RNA polymerase sigma-70 factor (ECF subfamily)